jgi:energy-coupling factor transport system substrate-specific component
MEFFIGVYVSNIYHDLAHALSTVFFLAVFSVSRMRILERFKKKYGIFQHERSQLVTRNDQVEKVT